MRGITVVSPMWGDRKITDRMIFSVLHQFISEKNPYKIHLVLVDDYIEGRINGKSYYEYYISEEFKQFYNPDFIEITLIINEEHKYQGESREIGFLAGKYKYFLLIDCDDMLAPNVCDKYLEVIRQNKKNLPLAYISGLVYGFDTELTSQIIPGDSIWVQSRCYNRDFILKHGIHFPKGLNSKQGEDYPFMMMLDYAFNHDPSYNMVSLITEENSQCTAYWFPNYNSLSRQPHYTQHLSGWTMQSSLMIINYFEKFNEENDIVDEEDEIIKEKILNMTIYSFYNLLDFLKEVSTTDYEPKIEDWEALKNAVKKLRLKLKEKYWNEILYSSVEDELYKVKNFSDVHFTESWIGNFYDFINNEQPILEMSYEEMIEYSNNLEFDEAEHEIHSPQVQAWKKRHEKEVD